MAKYHPTVAPYVESRVRALESLLLEKGILRRGAVEQVIQRFANDTGPLLGARIAARAWVDDTYRRALLDDSAAALRAVGVEDYDLLVVKENTAEVHNLVVCTLCSCYPWVVMGLPPVWYKMPPYRSRAVLEPRALLREMGLDLPLEVEIRVWDSSAELRYMVLPRRPAATDGWSEDRLAALLTRDHLIGVADVPVPK